MYDFRLFKKKYKFNPSIITIDYSLAELNAIKLVFPQIKVIPCFFHFMQNIVKRLPDLKSKTKVKKKIAKNLLSNFNVIQCITLKDIINIKNL